MYPISHTDKACRSRLPTPQLNRLTLQVDAIPFETGNLVVPGSGVEQHDNNIVNFVLPVAGPGGMWLSCQQMAEQSAFVFLGKVIGFLFLLRKLWKRQFRNVVDFRIDSTPCGTEGQH